MNTSKESRSGDEEEKENQEKKSPQCPRCRNHGMFVRKRGHEGFCPFADCECKRCGPLMPRRGFAALRCLKRGTGNPQGPAQQAGAAAASNGFAGGFGPPYPAAFGPPYPAMFAPTYPAAFAPPYPAAFAPPYPAAFEPPYPAAFEPPYPAAFEPPYPATFGTPNPAAFGPPYPAAYGLPNPMAFAPPNLMGATPTLVVSAPAASSTSALPPNIWNPAFSPSKRGTAGEDPVSGEDSRCNDNSFNLGLMGPIPLIPFPFVDSKNLRKYPPGSWKLMSRLLAKARLKGGATKNGPPTVPPLQQVPPQFLPVGPQGPPSNWMQFFALPSVPLPGTFSGPLGVLLHPQPTPPKNNPGT